MANIEDIKRILRQGIRFGAVGRIPQKQIDEAADRLCASSTITREMLEQIGMELIGDRLLFNDVDVDELQKVFEKKKKGAVVENKRRANAHSNP